MSDAQADETPVLELPEKLHTAAAEALFDDLKARRGGPLIIDAGAVQHLGGLCLQVLVSAQKTWASDQNSILFSNMSDGFVGGLNRLGAPGCLTAEGE